MMEISAGARKKAEDFLRISPQFRLGMLPTESQHPDTLHLSDLAKNNLTGAIDRFRSVDIAAIRKIEEHGKALRDMASDVEATLAKGRRIFLYGCGATGRLSLSLEVIWRFVHPGSEAVVSFMSGGDIALVRSIENFEDHPEFGARQVRELGFQEGDMMIATTEGGETPSVIGALEEAARISSAPHAVLFCNPPDLLAKSLERCRSFIENPAIRKIPILTGPMAISGSTRLQASTVLMLAVGMALFKIFDLKPFIDFYASAPLQSIAPFIEWESALYRDGGYCLYETNRYGITIFTDTTERSPTFSLAPVENALDSDAVPALAYLYFPQARSVDEAWKTLLLREPRPLEWPELDAVSNWDRLRGYNFSGSARSARETRLRGKRQECISIGWENGNCIWRAPELRAEFEVRTLHPLFEHIFLKLLLNIHSSLVMGRLGRYEGNLMTWVKPSNNKLIDRSIRYVQAILGREGRTDLTYADICYALFQVLENLKPEEPVVLKTLAALRS